MMMMRSAKSAASCRKWVAKNQGASGAGLGAHGVPKSLRDSGSMPVVGSSKISSCGDATRAIAGFTRWRSPEEATTLRLRSSVGVYAVHDLHDFATSGWLRAAIISMFALYINVTSRALVCCTALIFAFLAASFTPVPSTLMVPLVGWFSPSTMSSKGDLPAPFLPTGPLPGGWGFLGLRRQPRVRCRYLVTCFTSRACVALVLTP